MNYSLNEEGKPWQCIETKKANQAIEKRIINMWKADIIEKEAEASYWRPMIDPVKWWANDDNPVVNATSWSHCGRSRGVKDR